MSMPSGVYSVSSLILVLLIFSFLFIVWRAWRSFKRISEKMRLRNILNNLQMRSVVGKIPNSGPPVILASDELLKKINNKNTTEDPDYITKLLDINIILFCIQNDPFLMSKFNDDKVRSELHSIFSYFSNGTPSNEKLLTAIEENDKKLVKSFLDSTVDYLDFYVQQNIHPGELVSHYAAHAFIETKIISSESIIFRFYHRYVLKNEMLRTADWLCLAAFSRIPSVSDVLSKPVAIKIETE